MSQSIDPAIQAAAAKPVESPSGAETIDPLRKEGDALLVPEPGSPHHALYAQALEGLELLGPQRFKDRRERERVALAIAMQAAATGLTRIDRVAVREDGAGYFYTDTQAVDPAMRGYLVHAEALREPVQAASPQVADVQRQQQVQQRQSDDQARREVQQQHLQDARERQARHAREEPPPQR